MLPLLSTKEITVVFANIEDLLLTNTVCLLRTHYSSRSDDCLQGFVSSLEERQKDCRLYVDRIGDILFNHLPNMGVYMVRGFESFGSPISTRGNNVGILCQSGHCHQGSSVT
jgi:hypothetical protein